MRDVKYREVAETILSRCDALASISELPDGILRQYLTDEHKQANRQVADWLSACGLQTWQDAVGNQWGRLPAAVADAPRLIIGSHLDTVPYAGAYDGILGVLLGLSALEYFNDQPALPFHLDVVGFADEEGTRFGTTLIGSKALADQFQTEWLDIRDRDGVSMGDAMRNFGLNPDAVSEASLSSASVLAYWEAHIEQGPVLEAQGLSMGVVTGIAGAKRAHITVGGQAGHAGTTPMRLRRDALAGAAELINAVERIGQEGVSGDVATVGDLTVRPGAANVISGQCRLQLDVRSLDDDRRDAMIARIEQAAQTLARNRRLSIEFDWYHQAPAVMCDARVRERLTQAIERTGTIAFPLPSGAGHDAMAVASIAPVGMLFLRSPGGISHHPDEAVIDEDVAHAFHVLIEAIQQEASG